jgi:hypothetical protein
MTRESAEIMAALALSFLAGDDERLSRFIALSGLDIGRLRTAAAEPGFLAGVMAYLASDESLLLQFAAEAGAPPEQVAAACALLAGDMEG